MFRFFFVFALVFGCSAAPFHGPNQRSTSYDDSEIVDNAGAGYSFFKKQQIEVSSQGAQPNPLSSIDLSEYMRSSALNSRPTQPIFPQQQHQQVNRQFNQHQQSDFNSIFSPQQRNNFGQISHHDVQPWSNQQAHLIPQTNFNFQQKHFQNPSNFQTRQNLPMTNNIFNPPPMQTGRHW